MGNKISKLEELLDTKFNNPEFHPSEWYDIPDDPLITFDTILNVPTIIYFIDGAYTKINYRNDNQLLVQYRYFAAVSLYIYIYKYIYKT